VVKIGFKYGMKNGAGVMDDDRSEDDDGRCEIAFMYKKTDTSAHK